MFKVFKGSNMKKTKNSKAQDDLIQYAKKKNVSLQEIFDNDTYADDVADIFYKYLPKLVKLAKSKEGFRDYYKNNRHIFGAALAAKKK